MIKILRVLFVIFGGIFILSGMLCAVTANFTLGIILELMLGAVCVLLGLLFNSLKTWLKAIAAAVLSAALILCVCVWLYGVNDTADGTENVLIVLGAGVHGTTPTLPLQERLDAALEYLEENAEVYAVVTGGQGPQEDISEAEAMAEYLIERGIEEDRIFKEDKATSTSENFRYSKKIIDENFENAGIVTLTNDFHIYRAKHLAELEGIDTSTIHAKTPLEGRVSMYLRELLAIAKMWAIDMRK